MRYRREDELRARLDPQVQYGLADYCFGVNFATWC